ncbi:MAG: hypothetical protein EXS49_01705 [Candidatus Pacebacteria bacterium]|nr:hypothetical protein [Candidatus Paceibacterota bacterium]
MEEEKGVKWSSPEYHHYEKDVAWFWIVAVVTITLSAYAVWTNNLLFAIFSLIAGSLVIYWGMKHPEEIEFHINNRGINVLGRRFYQWAHLDGFSIIPDHHFENLSILILHTRHHLRGHIKVIIHTDREEEIRKTLKANLREIIHEESLVDHIARMLRF